MRKNERTLQMIQNYVRLHNEGKSTAEIAEMFNLSRHTIYDNLPRIAGEAGVSRESLLDRPHSKHSPCERITEPVKHIDTESLQAKILDALHYMGEFKELVGVAIEDSEAYEKTMGRIEYGSWNYESKESYGWYQAGYDTRRLLH